MKRWTVALAVPAAAMAVLVAAPAQASSRSGGGGGVRASGSCVGGVVWTLKAKPDNAAIEVELEIDTPRVGQTFAVRITDNGSQVFSGSRTTLAPSGSFVVRARTANRAGADHIVATASRAGRTCTARVTL